MFFGYVWPSFFFFFFFPFKNNANEKRVVQNKQSQNLLQCKQKSSQDMLWVLRLPRIDFKKRASSVKKSKRVDSVSRLTAVCSFALFATKALTHEPVPSSASSCCSFTNRSDLVLLVLRTLLSFLHTVRFPPRCRIYSFQCFWGLIDYPNNKWPWWWTQQEQLLIPKLSPIHHACVSTLTLIYKEIEANIRQNILLLS